jgi:hypothetical protein
MTLAFGARDGRRTTENQEGRKRESGCRVGAGGTPSGTLSVLRFAVVERVCRTTPRRWSGQGGTLRLRLVYVAREALGGVGCHGHHCGERGALSVLGLEEGGVGGERGPRGVVSQQKQDLGP